MWDNRTKKMVSDFDYIQEVRNQFEDMDSWRPLADCPWYGKLKNETIIKCLKKNKEKCNCSGKNCIYERRRICQ